MTIKKRIVALFMIMILIINPLPDGKTFADDKITVYFTCEKGSLGQGLIISPCKIVVDEGSLCSEVLAKVFADKGIKYEYSGTLKSDFYLSCIKNVDDGTVNIPKCISNTYGSDYYANASAPDLKEKSHTQSSGWIYYVNHNKASAGMSQTKVKDGDVIRIQYTLYDLGDDLAKVKKRDNLIKALADNENSFYREEGLRIVGDYDSKTTEIRNITNQIEEEAKVGNESESSTGDKENSNSQNGSSSSDSLTDETNTSGDKTSSSGSSASENSSGTNNSNKSDMFSANQYQEHFLHNLIF